MTATTYVVKDPWTQIRLGRPETKEKYIVFCSLFVKRSFEEILIPIKVIEYQPSRQMLSGSPQGAQNMHLLWIEFHFETNAQFL